VCENRDTTRGKASVQRRDWPDYFRRHARLKILLVLCVRAYVSPPRKIEFGKILSRLDVPAKKMPFAFLEKPDIADAAGCFRHFDFSRSEWEFVNDQRGVLGVTGAGRWRQQGGGRQVRCRHPLTAPTRAGHTESPRCCRVVSATARGARCMRSGDEGNAPLRLNRHCLAGSPSHHVFTRTLAGGGDVVSGFCPSKLPCGNKRMGTGRTAASRNATSVLLWKNSVPSVGFCAVFAPLCRGNLTYSQARLPAFLSGCVSGEGQAGSRGTPAA